MRRILLGFLAAVLCGAPALAQTRSGQAGRGAPGALPTGLEQRAPGRLTAFDPRQAELRQIHGRWVILANGLALKDFALREADARAALKVIRALKLTHHGTIGTPEPVMEYWLSEGHAPYADVPGLRLIPLDLNTLQAEEVEGQWRLRDAARLLFTFARRDDAYLALDAIRHYGFTQLGYVGERVPSMIYFLGSPTDLGRRPALPPPGGVVQAGFSPTASVEHVRFDPRMVQAKADRNEWRLVYGKHVLANFGPNQHEARLAWNVLQHYRFTEQYRLGGGAESFAYFLIGGQAPRGLKFGVLSQAFRPEAVMVRQVGDSYLVCEGERALVNFGPRLAEAQALVEAIRRHQFDHLCRVGSGAEGYGMTFLVRR